MASDKWFNCGYVRTHVSLGLFSTPATAVVRSSAVIGSTNRRTCPMNALMSSGFSKTSVTSMFATLTSSGVFISPETMMIGRFGSRARAFSMKSAPSIIGIL